ncbi:hypothetical protein ACIQ6K_39915 [Streptomyces sp. NPDC096354]|uniref:linalool dehydratase/isomerase domain-containing protein n=1 Tax=Streptomyces sp. NPDC096354 TaxID=3366088 RepID=UPI0037F2C783
MDAESTMQAPDISQYPALDDLQLGHLRHAHNLVAQKDNDWDGMGSARWGQEWSDSYRYQLTEMAYMLGFAHFHHLPAAPGVFRQTFEEILRKMQLPEVWAYWRETSRGSKWGNRDLTELREGWRDPVAKENIMFSGRYFAMLGMHSMLFDSDQYDRPGAIAFRWDPLFQGLTPEIYEYSLSSLADNLYWQMAEQGWYGIVCEPNCLFLVCNQFPILGWRFLDLRKGTSVADEVTRAYSSAWEKRGMLNEYGEYWRIWFVQQDEPFMPNNGGGSMWTALNMNAWNRDLVHELYPNQVRDEIRRLPNGLVTMAEPTAALEARVARLQGRDPEFTRDLDYTWRSSAFGYTAACMAEMGDTENLRGMLAYADQYMNPTWKDGGLFYPRNDASLDGDGNMVYMDRLTGNAMLGYARLNVPDGLWKMYNHPWTAEHFRQPNLAGLTGHADVVRAWFDTERSLLALTLRPHGPDASDVRLEIGNIDPAQSWTLFSNGTQVATSADSASPHVSTPDRVGAHFIDGRLVVDSALHGPTDFALTIH